MSELEVDAPDGLRWRCPHLTLEVDQTLKGGLLGLRMLEIPWHDPLLASGSPWSEAAAVFTETGIATAAGIAAWLQRHPRFVFHFTPTSCSWLNAVETFFSKLTRPRLKRGVFRSIVELQTAINRYVAETNADPKPFDWIANPGRVIAAVERETQALEATH